MSGTPALGQSRCLRDGQFKSALPSLAAIRVHRSERRKGQSRPNLAVLVTSGIARLMTTMTDVDAPIRTIRRAEHFACPRQFKCRPGYRDSVVNLDSRGTGQCSRSWCGRAAAERLASFRSPIDQRSLGTPQRVGPELRGSSPMAVSHSDRKPGILARRHALSAAVDPQTGTRPVFSRQLDVGVDGLAGWLGQLEPDRTSGLLLAHGCAIGA